MVNTFFVFETKKVDKAFSRWNAFGDNLMDFCITDNLTDWESFVNKYKNYLTFGFISYELLDSFGGFKSLKRKENEFPRIWWGVFKNTCLYDRISKAYIFNSKKSKSGVLSHFYYKVNHCAPLRLGNFDDKFKLIGNLKPNMSYSDYISNVRKIKKFIEQGDVYQVNLTFRIDGKFSGNPNRLYEHLNNKIWMPYSIFFSCDKFAFLVLSPELLLLKIGSEIYTRPIKGTIPNKNNNAEYAKNYFAHSIKDNRELDMIIDVERNDFYKICYLDSVKVIGKTVETFPNVHHLVGTVRGILKKGVTLSEVIESTFPSASVTGAPKFSAMKIINQIERHKRFIYTGGIGFHYKDLFVLPMGLRCIVFKNNDFHIYTGSGITYKSNPQKELKECMVKVDFYRDLLTS